jgi:uroporphyrinogen-III synthase
LKAKNILVSKKNTVQKSSKVATVAKAPSKKTTIKVAAPKKSAALKAKPAAKAKPLAKSSPVKKTSNKSKASSAEKATVVKVKKATVSKKVVEIPVAAKPKPYTAQPTPRNKVKSILVTQPKPEGEKSPYFDLAKKCNIKIDFREFIHVEGVPAHEFRKNRINILDHTAVIFTSRNAADHYFRMCQEMRITVPETMKYFCISESTAYYLQKYVIFRKRKIFHGKQTFADMMDVIKKHKDDKFLLPCTDIANVEGSELLEKAKISYTKAVIYKTVCSDLSDLANVNYDVIVFFSPSGIKSLFQNFPDFKQNLTRIAAFGATTAKAVEDANLYVDIKAPNPQAPSMTMALEQYVTAVNKGK